MSKELSGQMKTEIYSSEKEWEENAVLDLEVFLKDDGGVGTEITLENLDEYLALIGKSSWQKRRR